MQTERRSPPRFLIPAAAAMWMGIALAAQAHPQRAPLDANGDGSVDLAEIQAVRPEFTVEQFTRADANGDGLLSRNELRQAQGRARFGRLDKDGSGGASLPEMQAVRPGITAERFGELDANGDGQLSPDELRAAGQRRQRNATEPDPERAP